MSRKLLLIEDDLVYVKLIQHMLDSFGGMDFKIEHASGGRHGLDALARGAEPLIVLLDLHMPDMDGFQVLAEIRRRYGGALPVLVLTGSTEVHDEERSDELGATSFIPKPMARRSFEALFRTLDAMWMALTFDWRPP